MPWLGSRKPFDGKEWDGHHYVERSCPKQLQPEPKLLPKLSVFGKVKRFLKVSIRKLLRGRGKK